MIIRTKEIIELQNELDELEKFKNRNIIQHYFTDIQIGIGTKKDSSYVLLCDTIRKKKEKLAELYVKQMKRYLGKEGRKQ